jgi:hypothetical protein
VLEWRETEVELLRQTDRFAKRGANEIELLDFTWATGLRAPLKL